MQSARLLCQFAPSRCFKQNPILNTWKEHRVGVSSAGGRILVMQCEKTLNDHWNINVSETGLLTIIGHLDC